MHDINSTALYWFESYLQNRRYRVKICNHLSSFEALDYGVPQGSVLGPVLFALYTTPLSSLISSYALDHHLYADDTQLFTSFTPSNSLDSISSIETAFNCISDWMTHNFLAINPSKTEFILIGTPSQLSKLQNPALTISPSISILPVSSVRNLGVIFDKHLSLHDHITKVYQTCFFHIRDLRRIRPCLTLATASTIGTALVQSKLDYCNSLFVNLPNTEIHRLQFLQNSLARAIYRSPKHCHISPILQSLHWLKIPERISYKIVSLTYKLLHFSDPPYLSNLIQISPGSTRSSDYVTLVRPAIQSRSAVSGRAFQYVASQLWNSLPNHMKIPHPDNPTVPTLSHNEFHTELKKYLFFKSYPELKS